MGTRNHKVTIGLAPDVYRVLTEAAIAHCGNTAVGTSTPQGALQRHVWEIVNAEYDRIAPGRGTAIGKPQDEEVK